MQRAARGACGARLSSGDRALLNIHAAADDAAGPDDVRALLFTAGQRRASACRRQPTPRLPCSRSAPRPPRRRAPAGFRRRRESDGEVERFVACSSPATSPPTKLAA